MSLPIVIRQAQAEDHAFIYDSYIKSYGTLFIRSHGGIEIVPPTLVFHMHHKLMEKLLSKRTCLIACAEDSPEVILGWCIGDSLSNTLVIIDWCYVKKEFRSMKIAKMLYEALGGNIEANVAFTHYTPKARALLDKRCSDFVYAPYLLLEAFE